MTHGTIEQGNGLFQAQLLRLVHNERPARDKRGSVLQGRFTGDRLPRQTDIAGEKITGPVIGGKDMHVTPLLPGHQCQLSYPLPLTGCSPLSGDNPHRWPVLRQHADRIAEGGQANDGRIRRDGDVILALHLLAQGFHGQFVEDVDV